MKDQIMFYQNKLNYEVDAADLFTALETDPNIIVIDARKPHGYEQEHIPSAINLPHREMNSENTTHLDRSKTYICYCDGIGCNASTRGALNMTKLGFKAKELLGGIHWWKLEGYATQGTKAHKGILVACAC